MKILLVLILIALIIIIFKLTKLGKAKEVSNSTVLNKKINEKIKASELLLGITYPNLKEIHDQIINNDIDVDYLKEDFNFNKSPIDDVLCGEIEMFKDLESGQIERKTYVNESLEDISNELLLMFYSIDYDKRKLLASDIFKNKNLPE